MALGDDFGFGFGVLVDDGLWVVEWVRWLVCWGFFLWWGDQGEEAGSGKEGRKEGDYLCLRYFGVCGDVAVVLVGESGFGFAEVFAGGVEGGFGHVC